MSRAEGAGVFRFSPAHGATDGQYVPWRELRYFHTSIIQHRGFEKLVNLALKVTAIVQNGNISDQPAFLGTGAEPRDLARRKIVIWDFLLPADRVASDGERLNGRNSHSERLRLCEVSCIHVSTSCR